jgi:hypothetical protein
MTSLIDRVERELEEAASVRPTNTPSAADEEPPQ